MFVPLTLVVIVAGLIARIYQRSIYIIGVRLKNIPFLTHEIPHRSIRVTAELMMKTPVRTLPIKPTVEEVSKVLSLPIVHGFPVLDDRRRVVGLVSREALMVVIGAKSWIEVDVNARMEILSRKYQKDIQNVEQRFSMPKTQERPVQSNYLTEIREFPEKEDQSSLIPTVIPNQLKQDLDEFMDDKNSEEDEESKKLTVE